MVTDERGKHDRISRKVKTWRRADVLPARGGWLPAITAPKAGEPNQHRRNRKAGDQHGADQDAAFPVDTEPCHGIEQRFEGAPAGAALESVLQRRIRQAEVDRDRQDERQEQLVEGSHWVMIRP
ncbi:hypothetical protein [Burkholderia gladioli]|uniref:hypothetical protein n=1 Tax=Burkholderia gladioli TaxID=28095 RepID=UPI00163EE603|nr:hypothetical protein [Burkholderia gladioli]